MKSIYTDAGRDGFTVPVCCFYGYKVGGIEVICGIKGKQAVKVLSDKKIGDTDGRNSYK